MLLYITEIDISKDDGPGINEREFITALLDQCDDVMCAVPAPSAPENHFDSRIAYIPVFRGPQAARRASFAWSVLRWASSVHRRSRVEGVGIRIGVLPFLPVWLSHVLGVPVFLKTLAGYGMFASDAARRFRIIAPVLRPLYKLAVQRATMADTVSLAYVQWLQDAFGIAQSKLHLVPNGANVTTFTPGDRLEARRKLSLDGFDHLVGYIGALHGWRNLLLLIEAFASARLSATTGLVLVGGGPSRKVIEERVSALGLDGRVVLTGHVPYSRVPDYMRALDVAVDLTVVEMSVSTGTVLGSFSQKIPQYLASGVPVLAWDVPDTEFLVVHGIGRTVPYGAVDGLAGEMRTLLEASVAELTHIGNRARAYAVESLSSRVLAAERLTLWRRYAAAPDGGT